MEQWFLFKSVLGVRSRWMAESPPVQEKSLAVGLSGAVHLEVSGTTVRVIPKCAHQWLAWRHLGPVSKVLLQRLLSSWCPLLSLPGCPCWAPGRLCSCRVGGKGCVVPLRAVSQVSLLACGQFSVGLKGSSFLQHLCHVWLMWVKTLPPGDSRHNQLFCLCVDVSLS